MVDVLDRRVGALEPSFAGDLKALVGGGGV